MSNRYDRFGNVIYDPYINQYQQQYMDPGYGMDPNLSRSLTNHFYKLSTQTNMLMFGYILLMAVNHMIMGDIVYNPDNTYDTTKKNWFFSVILFCTIINCIILLWLKEKKRPVMQSRRGTSKVAPFLFGFFQLFILGFSLALTLSSTQTIESKKKIMTVITILGLNISVVLSTWGFSSSVCSIARADQFGNRTVVGQ